MQLRIKRRVYGEIVSTPLLSVKNVSCTYSSRKLGIFGKKEEKSVLDKVNLEINKGEFFGLTGESGSGKTTLGRCILGLIEYQGEILVEGLRPGSSGYHTRERGRIIGAVFQDPGGALNPVKKIGWLLEEPLCVHQTGSKKEREMQVDEMLNLIGLDPAFKKRRPDELSSGQKQRVSIGCALMLRPGLIIADEPVSSLDVSTGAQIINLFQDLKDSLGISLLFISHNQELIRYLCDRVAVMERGRIVELSL